MPSLHLLTDAAAIDALLARTHRVAVLGIKTEAQAGQPAYDVPLYLSRVAGLEVIPVPVYYPKASPALDECHAVSLGWKRVV
jgi:predicted CoA-binding protein